MNQQELYDRINAIARQSSVSPPLKVKSGLIPNVVLIESNIYAGTMDKLVKEFSGINEGIGFIDGELFVY